MHHRIVALVFTLSCAACGGAQTAPQGIEETTLVPPSSAPQEPSPTAKPTSSLLPGQIRRADLSAILSKGPGAVLAMVETEPYREKGQFVGFKVAAFQGFTPSAVDLREGDVLLRVNGLKIASPDDYFRAFQELQVASELRFDILRDGAEATLAYPVIE